MTTFVKKLEPMLDTKWMLISADIKNCPEYLEFRKMHNYIDYIDYTEYYGMKHRQNNLVRSTKKIIIGKDKLADRIITTNFDGKHLHQKIEREFPIKSNWLEEISDYSFTEKNLHMTRDDRHFEVSYSCDYKLCKDLLCKL